VILRDEHRHPAQLCATPPPGAVESLNFVLGDLADLVQRTGVLEELASGLLK